MKNVYSNDEIAHIWAHNGQNSARNAGGSMSFNGDYFYSYNTVIAQKFGDIILVSDRHYSSTTARHMSHIRRAARGPVVHCHNVNYTPAENFAVLEREVLALADRQTRAKKVDYIAQADAAINEFKKYADLLEYKMPADTVEKIAKLNEKQIKKAEAAKKAAAAQRKKDAAEFLAVHTPDKIMRAYNVARAAFHTGHNKPYRAIMRKLENLADDARHVGARVPVQIYPDFMRVTDAGGVITNRGVNISHEEARGLFLALKSGADVVGSRVSHYRIDAINEHYMQAGCHTFPRSEISYISQKLFGEAV